MPIFGQAGARSGGALVNDLRGESGIVAGQIVTTGTYTGLNFAKPGQSVTATFHGFGSVTVAFA